MKRNPIRKSLVAILLFLSSLSLYAGDFFDISLSFGHSTYRWFEKGISASYGMNFGLSERWELDLWGISEIVPKPFKNNLFGIEFGYSLLGRRTSGTSVAGSGINTLISFGGFYRMENNGAGPIVSITPLTVGNPITGRRERILKTGIGYDFVNNEVIVTFSLLNIDCYVRGTYRDYV